jgi:hypothetical protein
MKIVATIEVQLPDPDEESKGQVGAMEKLKNDPQVMMDWIYSALEGDAPYGIHSPHLEEGEI